MSTTQRDTDIKYMYAAYIYLYGYIFIMCRNFKRPQSYSSSWCIFNSCHEAASDICISKIYFLSSYTIQLRQTELTFQHGHIYIQIVTTHMYMYVYVSAQGTLEFQSLGVLSYLRFHLHVHWHWNAFHGPFTSSVIELFVCASSASN